MWKLLGFGWFASCTILAIFSLSNGMIRFIVWMVFGIALLIFHLQMAGVGPSMGDNLVEFIWVIKTFSTIALLFVFFLALKKSLGSDK